MGQAYAYKLDRIRLCYMSLLVVIASSRISKTITRRRLVGNDYRNDSSSSDISENSAHMGSPPKLDQDFIIRHDTTITRKAESNFPRLGDVILSKIIKWKSKKTVPTIPSIPVILVNTRPIKHICCDPRVDDLKNPRCAEEHQITDAML